MAVTAGCASSDVEARRSYVGSEQIARPGRIIVYDFAATAEGVAPSSAISGRYGLGHRPQSSEEIRLGRELGRRVADALVKDILAMGLPAERAHTGPPPNIGDLAITGGSLPLIDMHQFTTASVYEIYYAAAPVAGEDRQFTYQTPFQHGAGTGDT